MTWEWAIASVVEEYHQGTRGGNDGDFLPSYEAFKDA